MNVSQDNGKLNIAIDPENINSLDTIIALTLDRLAKDIKPIVTVGQTLTIGATASASSEYDKRPANSVVASDAKEFSEGIFVKSAWSPARDDKSPWLQVTLKKSETVEQILIREGTFGKASAIQNFNIEAMIDGKWKIIYSGKQMGGGFGLVLGVPVTSNSFRIVFKKWKGGININSFDLLTSVTKE